MSRASTSRGMATFSTGVVSNTRRASICSLTCIDPSSEAFLAPVLAASMSPVMTGPSSLHEQSLDEPGNGDLLDRRRLEHPPGVDLFAHLHRSELRGVLGSRSGGKHEPRNDRPQLPDKRKGGRAADKELRTERFEPVPPFNRHD